MAFLLLHNYTDFIENYRLIVKIFVENIKMLVLNINILMFSREKNNKITEFLACFSKK